MRVIYQKRLTDSAIISSWKLDIDFDPIIRPSYLVGDWQYQLLNPETMEVIHTGYQFADCGVYAKKVDY